MVVLGIETSCDETAAAVVRDDRTILANLVRSQDHADYGGVVPEVAARAHVEDLDHLIAAAFEQAQIDASKLSAVAATAGPGLIGGIIVGLMTGKAIALAQDIPFVAVNHLEGHALAARLTEEISFPYLLLLVSGGHCQLLISETLGHYRRLGTTLDDAVGEAFDKTARLLGLGFPGGPAVEQAAIRGDPLRFDLPRPMVGRPGCDFSFSGLKTAVRRQVAKIGVEKLHETDVDDLSAAFQAAVAEVLVDRTKNAIAQFRDHHPESDTLVVAGGVAANRALRSRLAVLADSCGLRLVAPTQDLCTDNAAMIAWAGVERRRIGLQDSLDVSPRARWQLDETIG